MLNVGHRARGRVRQQGADRRRQGGDRRGAAGRRDGGADHRRPAGLGDAGPHPGARGRHQRARRTRRAPTRSGPTAVEADALGRCAFTLHEKAGGVPTTPVRVQLGLSGRHQVANAVAAAALARALGVGRDDDRRRPGRRPAALALADGAAPSEPTACWSSTTRTTPTRSRCARPWTPSPSVLADRPGAGGWAVLGDMLELGAGAAAEHRALGAYAADRGITRIVALGEFADEVVAGAAERLGRRPGGGGGRSRRRRTAGAGRPGGRRRGSGQGVPWLSLGHRGRRPGGRRSGGSRRRTG